MSKTTAIRINNLHVSVRTLDHVYNQLADLIDKRNEDE